MYGVLEPSALSAAERKEYRYTKSVVAFLDILGFKEHVRNEKNVFLFASAFEAIRALNDVDFHSFRSLKGVQVSVMSDSIVISVPFRQSGALSRVVTCAYALIETLM